MHYDHQSSTASLLFLSRNSGSLRSVRAPSGLFVSLRPRLLHIAQGLFDLMHGFGISSILPNIITDFDSRSPARRGDFDDDI